MNCKESGEKIHRELLLSYTKPVLDSQKKVV